DFVYPTLGNRMSPKEWEESEKPDLMANAIKRKAEILAAAGSLIPPDLDTEIRAKYPMYFSS
ncbi:MAG TPA: methyltransferase, partial [Roseibacterium sp.]|nr:methyltransferase [Roseibacterium sp.]